MLRRLTPFARRGDRVNAAHSRAAVGSVCRLDSGMIRSGYGLERGAAMGYDRGAMDVPAREASREWTRGQIPPGIKSAERSDGPGSDPQTGADAERAGACSAG